MHIVGKWDEPWMRRERGYNTLIYMVDNVEAFVVREGELEDRTLYRDLADCRKLIDLMKLAYEAGKRGELFTSEFHASGALASQ